MEDSNLEKLVLQILEWWEIKDLVSEYRFRCTTDNGADITAAMERRGWKNVGA